MYSPFWKKKKKTSQLKLLKYILSHKKIKKILISLKVAGIF